MVDYVSISGATVRVPMPGPPTPSREEYKRYEDAILEILQEKEPYSMRVLAKRMHSRGLGDESIVKECVWHLIDIKKQYFDGRWRIWYSLPLHATDD